MSYDKYEGEHQHLNGGQQRITTKTTYKNNLYIKTTSFINSCISWWTTMYTACNVCPNSADLLVNFSWTT